MILIGHFWVALCLCVESSLRANPFIWKCVPPTGTFSFKVNSFSYERTWTWTWKDLDLFWNRSIRYNVIAYLYALTTTQVSIKSTDILIPRGHAIGQHQESRALAGPNFLSMRRVFHFVFSSNQICQIWRKLHELWSSGVGPPQRSWFLALTKRSMSSEEKNGV